MAAYLLLIISTFELLAISTYMARTVLSLRGTLRRSVLILGPFCGTENGEAMSSVLDLAP